MKKKQLFAGALAAAMMTASLAGCGGAASSAATSTTGGDTAGSTASADTNSGVVEVTIPSFKTGENVGAVFFEPQVERFNEKYAGKYKINLESVPQDSIFNDRIKQLAQQNKLPVLVEGGDPDWVKNVVIPNGLAYDLTDWIDATPAVKDVLIDDSREYCSNEDGRVMVILLHIHEPISLTELAELVNLSPNHLSALFLKETSFRPTEYIRAQKLNYARYILDNYSPTIATLANLLAFPSPSAFARQFKQQYGLTPTEYQRRKE